MSISIFNELNADASQRVVKSVKGAQPPTSHGQELYKDTVPPPQIGLWQQCKLSELFSSVCHVLLCKY